MIHVISHCWAEKNAQFADALVYQLSSLALFSPREAASVTVVCSPTDTRVARVVELFQRFVDVQRYCLPLEKLGRRSIGRNYVAKCLSSEADLVWFADVDYVFGAGCLEALARHAWEDDCVMVFPRKVLISRTHADGDSALSRAARTLSLPTPAVLGVDPDDFVEKRYFRAIGGAQVVQGDFARKYGYLDNDLRWQRSTSDPFGDTREDVYYRRFCERQGRIVGIDLPNVYRLRHSEGHPR